MQPRGNLNEPQMQLRCNLQLGVGDFESKAISASNLKLKLSLAIKHRYHIQKCEVTELDYGNNHGFDSLSILICFWIFVLLPSSAQLNPNSTQLVGLS